MAKHKFLKSMIVALGLAVSIAVACPNASAQADAFSGGDYSLDDKLTYRGDELEKVWKPYDHLSNFKLEQQDFVVGQESKIEFSFECDVLPTVTEEKYRKSIYIGIDGPQSGAWMLSFAGYDYKAGERISDYLELTFSEPGRYTISVYECDENGNIGVLEPQQIAGANFTVKALTDENGNRIKNKVSTDKGNYTQNVKETVTLEYVVENASHDYNLYVFEPGAYSYNDSYTERIMDWYSIDGVMDIKAGQVCKKSFTYTFKKGGTYRVYLVDLTTNDMVVETSFEVTPELDFGVDESQVVDGKLPFSVTFTKNKTHLDLDSDDIIKFSVQLPYKYESYKQDYLRELERYDYDESRVDFDYDNTMIDVKINYQPAGSSKTITLKKEIIYGYLKPHEYKFTTKDILDLINEYSYGDTAYAGVVTIEFSNSSYGTIYLDQFTESVSFSVARSSKKIKTSALKKSVTLAYGESIGFNVESDLGGEIVAEIYKGSKKIRTIKQACNLDRANFVSYGTIYWDLGNANGKYVAAGQYKIKLYTQVKLTVINNGKNTTKTLKSNKKTIKFKVVKPSGSLSLSSVATGLNGGEYATYENPLIGIKNTVSIGSKISVQIKNSKGTVIKNDSYTQSSGNYTRWYDLAQLDSNLAVGKYTASITATTLEGKKATKNITFTVEKSPKVELSSVSLSTNDGLGTVSLKTSQSSSVTVQVKNSSGSVLATVIDGQYAAGTVKANFNFGSYAVGSYSVVITAKNSGGTSTSTKTFSVAKKPVVVNKPTISALAVRFTQKNSEDAYKVTCNYTGKGSKIVVEVMWNDAEQIVAVYEHTAQKDSGSVEWVWDGYKSNGFRASSGSYTIRAYAVNSAGKTEYIRQNFTISEG